MKRHRPYIIKSLLDLDFYKLTMGYLVFLKYPSVLVKYLFKNRTLKVPLARVIKETDLRDELNHVRTLRAKTEEVEYIENSKKTNGKPLFNKAFAKFFSELRLPEFKLRYEGDNIILEFFGTWKEAMYWETIALSIINELYSRYLESGLTRSERRKLYREAKKRLAKKISILKTRPDIRISEFGTRRRRTRRWQEYVVATLARELGSQLLGTSNVYLAMKYELKPIGTCAHEMFMGMSGVMHGSERELLSSHNQVLKDWEEVYGDDLLIALTDTYGSEFFFRDMTAEQARKWSGLRHDSGDPFHFGDRAIEFYKSHGIDPTTKMIVFSDGLDIDTIVRLADYFKDRIKVSFGWGTNLTNDFGQQTLSIVIKLMESCGFGTVKLSDNIAKAMGDPDDIDLWILLTGYSETFSEQPIV